jgi:hypothetical protein
MAKKRPGQFGDNEVTLARKQKTAVSRDDQGEDTGMDVVSIQELEHHTEVQQELPSDPSTSQVESHDEFAVPEIRRG